MSTPEEVLDVWFGPIAEDGTVAPEISRRWYSKDPDFDEELRVRFGQLLERAGKGDLDSWRATPRGRLALIVLLDQLSRNLHRDSARAFENDVRAVEIARDAFAANDHESLRPPEVQFLIMPLMHSEALADQDECIRRFERAAARFGRASSGGLAASAEFGRKHRVIIERFGRFPHRNGPLGRESTPEEIEFLKQPGSSF